MANGIYRAVSGSIAQMRNLEVVANNLAHVDTPGYKADALRFEEALQDAQGTGFVDTPTSHIRLNQGALAETGNPLDVALNGPGFLVVDTPEGQRLTRAGQLIVGSDGNLKTASGHTLMGTSGPINIPPLSPENAGPLTIDPSGRVLQGSQELGALRVVDAPVDQLSKVGTDLFDVHSGVGGLPTGSARVLQGHLEGANVSPIQSMTQLIQVQRHFDALQKAVKAYRDIDGQSIRRMR